MTNNRENTVPIHLPLLELTQELHEKH